MKKPLPTDPNRILQEERPRIHQAFRRGVQEALLRHKERGLPVVIERNGKIEWVPAEELLDEQPTKVAERPDREYGEDE